MNTNTEGAGHFDALLAEIQGQSESAATLAKSMEGCDDAKIEAAAAEGADEDEDEDEDGKKDPKDGDDKGEAFGKSFVMRGEDGEEVEGYDATDLIKSLLAKTETLEANSTAGLQAVVGLVKQQGELIKSLAGEIVSLRGQGRGRKAVLAVTDKPAGAGETLSKALPAAGEGGMPPLEFKAKTQQAAEEGLISWHQAAHAETCMNKALSIEPEVLHAVAKIVARENA